MFLGIVAESIGIDNITEYLPILCMSSKIEINGIGVSMQNICIFNEFASSL